MECSQDLGNTKRRLISKAGHSGGNISSIMHLGLANMLMWQVIKEREKYVFVPKVPTKYRHDPSKFLGIHLVPQVSKPDKLGPKPDFEHVDRV